MIGRVLAGRLPVAAGRLLLSSSLAAGGMVAVRRVRLAASKSQRASPVHALGMTIPASLSTVAASAAASSQAGLLSRVAQALLVLLAVAQTWLISTGLFPEASLEAAQQQGAIDPAAVKAFLGSWSKDARSSEPIDPFLRLFSVPSFLRSATRLMSGMSLSLEGDTLVVKQVCKVGWLSTTETYKLDGQPGAPCKRRDLRPGKQVGSLLSASEDAGLTVRAVWPGCEARDTLRLSDGGQRLVVLHQAVVEGRGSASFREVFVRR